MNQDEKRTFWEQIRIGTMVGCAGIFGLFGLIFAPLALSIAEETMFGSNHVYNFFNQIHLADPLGVIYTPVMDIIDQMLP